MAEDNRTNSSQNQVKTNHENREKKLENVQTLRTSNNNCKQTTDQPINYYDFTSNKSFYTNAQKYWSTIDPTIDGMLGGLSSISASDIQGSQQFLQELYKTKPQPGKKRALDCGAGIGRVTKYLLMPQFDCVDLVEQDGNFVNKARDYLNSSIGGGRDRLGTIFNVGLQDFTPSPNTYDIIWSQWVLGHLTDDDLAAFLHRCSKGLSKNGFIVIKENFTANDDVFVDDNDSSVTRSLKLMKSVLEMADLRIVRMIRQQNFIQGLFPVYMIACKPNRIEP